MNIRYGEHKIRFFGQSMVEAVVAVGIVILLVSGLVVATTSTLRFGQMSKDRTQALQYAKEGMEIVRIIKETDWNVIWDKTVGTLYCIPTGTPDMGAEGSCTPLSDRFTRTVVFSNDATCLAVNSCRTVTVTVSWAESGSVRSVTLTSYLTNWRGNL